MACCAAVSGIVCGTCASLLSDTGRPRRHAMMGRTVAQSMRFCVNHDGMDVAAAHESCRPGDAANGPRTLMGRAIEKPNRIAY